LKTRVSFEREYGALVDHFSASVNIQHQMQCVLREVEAMGRRRLAAMDRLHQTDHHPRRATVAKRAIQWTAQLGCSSIVRWISKSPT
jgi:hypothetical protein